MKSKNFFNAILLINVYFIQKSKKCIMCAYFFLVYATYTSKYVTESCAKLNTKLWNRHKCRHFHLPRHYSIKVTTHMSLLISKKILTPEMRPIIYIFQWYITDYISQITHYNEANFHINSDKSTNKIKYTLTNFVVR